MTDSLDRFFVEIKYDSNENTSHKVRADLEGALRDFEHTYTISPDKPPSIFSEDEIEDRFLDLYLAAAHFCNKFKDCFGSTLEIDLNLLYIAVISAYDDIARYKSYHLEKPYKNRSDGVKRSAYLTKWIVRVCPLQTIFSIAQAKADLAAGNFKVDAKPAIANIQFAIMVSKGHLSLDHQEPIHLSDNYEFQFTYDLLYRRINEDALLAAYQKISDLAEGNRLLKH